jgi:hypothetical protein
MQSQIDERRVGIMSRFRFVVHVLQWIVIGLGLVSLPIPLLVAIEDAETQVGFVDMNLADDPTHYLTITTVQPELKHVGYNSLLVLIVSGIILSLVGLVCRAGTILSCIACIVVSVAIVFSCCAGSIRNLAPWQYGPPIQGPDGRIYYVMESSFWQGQTLVLAGLEHETSLQRTSRVLVETNGDSPQTWQTILRPATANDDGVLAAAISPTGLLCGFRYDDHCFFAYDLNAEKRYGRNNIRNVSPFVLLSADTPLHEPDVERVAKRIREFDGKWRDNGIPKIGQLEDGLHHPNPAVNAVAKRLLDIPRQ